MQIHYIVAFYLGDRGTLPVNDYLQKDRYHYVKKHIEVLNSLELPHIHKATFIISEYQASIDSKVQDLVNNTPCKIPIEVYYRKNEGYSYAGWNEVITKSVNNNEDTDYYFLIEDDYIPHCNNFYEPFVNECKKNVAFVSQVWRENHAAVSNGLLSGVAARLIRKHYKQVFCINEKDDTYTAGVLNQIHFLDYAKKLNLSFSDVCKSSLQIFLDRKDFTFWGNTKGKILIVPESSRDWEIALRDERFGKWRNVNPNKKTKGITDETIAILNKFRNRRAKAYSKNPVTFTDEEAIVFFKKNLKNIYIVYEDDSPSGYIQIIEDKEVLRIQPHLRKRFDDRDNFTVLSNLISWIHEKNKDKEIISHITQNNEFLLRALTACGFTKHKTLKNNVTRMGIPEDVLILKRNLDENQEN